MDWEFVRIITVVGGLGLVLQMGIAAWYNRFGVWRGIGRPVCLYETLGEWAVYMVIFVVMSILLQELLELACLICRLK